MDDERCACALTCADRVGCGLFIMWPLHWSAKGLLAVGTRRLQRWLMAQQGNKTPSRGQGRTRFGRQAGVDVTL
jgi:hypothetical protein